MDTRNLEKEFHVSKYIIAYKIILGIFELLLGLGMIFFGNRIFQLYINFRTAELLEDPHDLLVNIIERFVPYIFEHQGLIVFLLFLLAVVKIAGAVGLYYRRHWGLDLLVGLTILLLPFEGYHLLAKFSLLKLSYFIINIFIALYLVNFKPKHYFVGLRHRIGRK